MPTSAGISLMYHRYLIQTAQGEEDKEEGPDFAMSLTTILSRSATKLLGTMQGGYNVATLVELLDDATLAPLAVEGLKHTLLVFDAFYDVEVR
jgi:hypothetical protein